jgi:hypothetical protein
MTNVPARSADPRDTRDKARFAQFTRSILQVVAVAVGLLVGYLQIKDIKADVLLTPSTADSVWRLALILIYWSCVAAINFEIHIQELAYVTFPGHGRWRVKLYVVLAVFVLSFAALLTSYGNITHFSVALTCFLLADCVSWLYLQRFFRSSIDESRIYYSTERKFYELALVERHMFGAKAGVPGSRYRDLHTAGEAKSELSDLLNVSALSWQRQRDELHRVSSLRRFN